MMAAGYLLLAQSMEPKLKETLRFNGIHRTLKMDSLILNRSRRETKQTGTSPQCLEPNTQAATTHGESR